MFWSPPYNAFPSISTDNLCFALKEPAYPVCHQGGPLASEDGDGSANGGPSHLFFLEDDLVEKVLKVLVCIVDAQLLEAVEAQVLLGRW